MYLQSDRISTTAQASIVQYRQRWDAMLMESRLLVIGEIELVHPTA
jgi:hypothetical protein